MKNKIVQLILMLCLVLCGTVLGFGISEQAKYKQLNAVYQRGYSEAWNVTSKNYAKDYTAAWEFGYAAGRLRGQ